MGGICDFSVKRSLRCYISIDLLKIEPGHFPEGELRFQPQDWASREQVQVDSGMATMGHEPHCLCAALLILLSSFLKLILTIFFVFSCTQGGVPKQVLFRPGLQVPSLYF